MERVIGIRGNVLRSLNFGDIVPLPPDTPYGNLLLKLADVVSRLIHANRRLDETEAMWQAAHGPFDPSASDVAAQHRFSADEVVVQLRRAMDELIGMIWLLRERETLGRWPERIAVDSIGSALKPDRSWALTVLEPHDWLARTLNEIANAHKHSFIDSNFYVAGAEEPCVVALGLKRNDLGNPAVPYVVSLDALVKDFNSFYSDSMKELMTLNPAV